VKCELLSKFRAFSSEEVFRLSCTPFYCVSECAKWRDRWSPNLYVQFHVSRQQRYRTAWFLIFMNVVV